MTLKQFNDREDSVAEFKLADIADNDHTTIEKKKES